MESFNSPDFMTQSKSSNDVKNDVMKCRHCNEDVRINVFPLHEYVCKTAKDEKPIKKLAVPT